MNAHPPHEAFPGNVRPATAAALTEKYLRLKWLNGARRNCGRSTHQLLPTAFRCGDPTGETLETLGLSAAPFLELTPRRAMVGILVHFKRIQRA